MLGYQGHEIEPRVESWRERVHPEDLERADVLLRAHLDGLTTFYECEHRLRSKDGAWVWVLARGRGVERDDAGRPTRVVGTHLDVTERRLAIEALREADRRKDEFLAVLSHELRNPLAPLTNALRLLERSEALGAPEREWLAIAGRQRAQLKRLVDDLLEVSRVSRGLIALRCESMSVRAAVRDALEGAEPLARERGQRLEATLPADACVVDADPARIAQILGNLLHNASKFTPEGGTIRVVALERDLEVELRVEDTGIGIEAAQLSRLFEPFVQLDEGGRRSEGGLGIGLALVRRLAELHGGTVRAESAGRGRGTAFVLRLPKVATSPG
jgi:PAS domain S-box-containing protein